MAPGLLIVPSGLYGRHVCGTLCRPVLTCTLRFPHRHVLSQCRYVRKLAPVVMAAEPSCVPYHQYFIDGNVVSRDLAGHLC